MAGEGRQLTGQIAVQRAKRWLHYSTRVASIYTNTDKVFKDLLHFRWPHGGQEFSFDLGGKFRGGDLQDQSFMAEVKGYRYEMDSVQEYRKFVAECYVAFQENLTDATILYGFLGRPSRRRIDISIEAQTLFEITFFTLITFSGSSELIRRMRRRTKLMSKSSTS